MAPALPAPLAVSLGDPAGIGPELLATAWAARDVHGLPPFFAVGGADVLSAAARQRGLDIQLERIADPAEAAAVFPRALPVFDTIDGAYRPGVPDRAGAELALASLTRATALAVAGQACGVVTGPIAKSLLAEVGFVHPGQTEFVAAACGVAAENAVMMLAGPALRTVPLTVHVALAEVPRLVTTDLILRRGRIVAAALTRDFGIARPRVAVAALNPHAGEDGRFGTEDQAVVAPAIAALQAEGIAATGPHAADALFAPHNRGTFDVALCMYHDQALIPIKALDFDAGVNVTLGLPIVRTSPDHGTAFGIAGQALAHPGATMAAIRLAGECAARRRA
ncbi:4-hydroxythreonine-4-phosphate dehydrogenase PdxA [Novosphingobium flavum]|uniref:4-hydroxythreonine-4-phosphate dehydrogenase n=1 Tax=Novosphingobium aerophilum TaxID=2839843 RepID=A0A7X1F9H8_9SPHN|nr:4-hydroxythreonine-4-phosphate dehydrogenase PdxA [Novosphingobium aerophilum]MBC2652862.1 4-hydroxythreonine-4-phosphate dehydrogenase PdxA [Novosphingobium aerophilum]MBC2663579.1 4-hydroxythreonine-4-phosphate dehydrogenase PdxA [Novosphingobium aerophilum]